MSGLVSHVDGLLHETTQVHDGVVDLSVTEVFEVDAPGNVDFGGGELQPAEVVTVRTEQRHHSDEYGWWHLDAGQYLIEYNETLSLPEGQRAVVQTRDVVRQSGAFHPTLHARELGHVPLSVCESGIHLKENARVSTLVEVR